jgi:hypothetical protein
VNTPLYQGTHQPLIEGLKEVQYGRDGNFGELRDDDRFVRNILRSRKLLLDGRRGRKYGIFDDPGILSGDGYLWDT